jgi:hypothetical protein
MNTIEKIRAEIDRRYEENREKARYDDYYRGMNDGLDHFEQFLDTLSEEPVSDDLEKEISTWIPAHIRGGDDGVWRETKNVVTEWGGIVARHFAQWGAERQKEKMIKEMFAEQGTTEEEYLDKSMVQVREMYKKLGITMAKEDKK